MNKENEEGKDADAVPSGVQGICPRDGTYLVKQSGKY